MKNKLTWAVVVMLILFCGCSSPSIVTKWKDKSLVDRNYHKILVVGILNDSLVDLRRNLEDHMVAELRTLGYDAVSALEEYGAGGLLKLEQEETYVSLCNKGIDAVISMALLDKGKQRHHLPSSVNDYSSQYYYNRIWSYRSMQAGQVISVGVTNYNKQIFWETLLFDLATLTPAYSAQTKTFPQASLQSSVHTYSKMFIAKMVKTKVLYKQPAKNKEPLRAF